jgi:Kef-type K+ transport system membrane component KefB
MLQFLSLMNTLLLIGTCIILGLSSTKISDWLGVPHVVGFITLGVILGISFLNYFSLSHISNLGFISDLALGFIGFGMGEHLRLSQLRKLGKPIILIALCESIGAFLIVSVCIYLLSKSLLLALVFGSLASATAPAATVDVIKQYQSRGNLTTTLLAVIGIDDAIALFLYSLVIPVSLTFSLAGTQLQPSSIISPFMEIFGSIIIGVAVAFPVDYILDKITDREEELLFIIGAVFAVIGIAITLHLSVILMTLCFGAATINLKHKNASYITRTIERVGPILYILFFVLVGANMDIRLLPRLGIIGVVYIIARAVGKIGGAYIGAVASGAQSSIRKYLGLALFSQAGVAVGLALSFSSHAQRFGSAGSEIEKILIPTIIATTLVIQIIGPLLTKYAIFASGEASAKKGTFYG